MTKKTNNTTSITIQANKVIGEYNISSLLALGGIHNFKQTSDKTEAYMEYTDNGVTVHFTKQEDLFTVNDVIKLMWNMTN